MVNDNWVVKRTHRLFKLRQFMISTGRVKRHPLYGEPLSIMNYSDAYTVGQPVFMLFRYDIFTHITVTLEQLSPTSLAD